MNGKFFVVFNDDMEKFLSIYEDGEGNEFFNLNSFLEVNQNCIFDDKELAEFKLKEAINLAGFYRYMPNNMREFCMGAKVKEISIFLPEVLKDGLGDVGDDDLADTAVSDIKQEILEDDVLYEDFSAEIQKCPVCGGRNVWTFLVTNCIWEIWAKCTSIGCGHVWCIATE